MLDLTYPPLWHYRYEHDLAYREAEMPGAAAAASGVAAGGAGLSASMAMAKAAPPMPGDDNDSNSGSGGHRMGNDSVPRRNPDDPDDDDDDGDEESGLPLGLGGAGGAGGADHEEHELSFFQSIFDFVWGHGRPTCAGGASFESVMWTALANRIRANGGTVLAEECKPFVLEEGADLTVGQQLAKAYGPPSEAAPAAAPAPSSASAPISASAQPHVPRRNSDAHDIDEHGPLLGRSASAAPSSIADPNARYMLPVLAHFGGHAVVSPDGTVVAYTFPMFVAQYHRLREAGQLNGQRTDSHTDATTGAADAGPNRLGPHPTLCSFGCLLLSVFFLFVSHSCSDPSVVVKHSFAREPLWSMSHCTSSQVWWAAGLGVFNLALVLFFPVMVRWSAELAFIEQTEEEAEESGQDDLPLHFAWWLLSSIHRLYPFLLTYAMAFFLVPAARWLLLRYVINARIVRRNAKRRAWSLALRRSPPERFRHSVAVARSLGLEGHFSSSALAAAASGPASSSASSASAPRVAFAAASSSTSSPSVSTAVVYETVSRRIEDETRAWEAMQLAAAAGEDVPLRPMPSRTQAHGSEDKKQE